MIKKVLKIKGMHCGSCAMSIEWELEDIGVKAKCSYAKAQVEVEFDPKKVSEDKIVMAIGRVGYSVTD